VVPKSGDRFNGTVQPGQGIDETLTTGSGFRVSPRIGFVYDVSGRESAIVRGSFGIFYDRPQGNLAFELINNSPDTSVEQLTWGRFADLRTSVPLNAPVALTPTQLEWVLPRVYAWNVGAQAAVAFWDAMVTVAFHQTGDGSDIRTPYGSWPGYLALINKDFDRAGETAWGVKLDYDFARLGVPGLHTFFWFAQGFSAIDPATDRGAPDRLEYDFDVTYAPPKGWFRGLSIKARLGLVDQEGVSGLLPDIRLILNYPLRLL
jgi:hypothetical protein